MTLNNNYFSVVIPTYNRTAFLEEAINSVFNQTHSPCEIIVVDDLLLEETKLLIDRMDNNVKIPILYIKNIIKTNAQTARNIGAGCAKGKYLAFLDDDDLWDKEYLESVNGVIDKENCDIVVTHTVAFDKNNNQIVRKLFSGYYDEQEFFIRNPGIACSNIVIKSSCFMSVKGFDEYVNGSADKEIFIRLKRENYSHITLKEQLVFYRIGHSDQWSASSFKILPDILRFYKKYFFSLSMWTHIKMNKKIIKILIDKVLNINQLKT